MPARWIPQPVLYLGRISYGLYVFHELVLYQFPRHGRWWLLGLSHPIPALRGVLSLGVTIGVAALSYQFFEKPFLRRKERFTFVASRKA